VKEEHVDAVGAQPLQALVDGGEHVGGTEIGPVALRGASTELGAEQNALAVAPQGATEDLLGDAVPFAGAVEGRRVEQRDALVEGATHGLAGICVTHRPVDHRVEGPRTQRHGAAFEARAAQFTPGQCALFQRSCSLR
jgi:hypothetical protein